MRTKARGYVAMPVGGATPKTVSDELALHITLQGIVNAVGDKLPLLVLLKGAGERLTKDPLEGLPPDSAVIFTPKAWTNEQSFFLFIRWYAWHLDSRYPHLRDKGQYALLLVDGHSSRFNPTCSNLLSLTTSCSSATLLTPPRSCK
jgi:hypothetical protein